MDKQEQSGLNVLKQVEYTADFRVTDFLIVLNVRFQAFVLSTHTEQSLAPLSHLSCLLDLLLLVETCQSLSVPSVEMRKDQVH